MTAHDLLRLAPGARLLDAAGNAEHPPPWVGRALLGHGWAVVRRDLRRDGRVPVGIRGRARRQRYGAWVEGADVLEAVAPEELAAAPPAGRWAETLHEVGTGVTGWALPWGPVGSVGFEVATRMVATGATSDLDLLVRAPSPLPDRGEELAALLHRTGRRLGLRLDCLVETPAGGVHLDDLSTHGVVLARTDRGPLLVDDPWQTMHRGRPRRARA